MYLDVLDHFIIDTVPSLDGRPPHFPSPFEGEGQGEGFSYIRYMDDFLIFANNKEDLHIYLAYINLKFKSALYRLFFHKPVIVNINYLLKFLQLQLQGIYLFAF